MTATDLQPLPSARTLLITTGVIGVIAGVPVSAWPGASVLELLWISGSWMTLFGVLRIILGFTVPAAAQG